MDRAEVVDAVFIIYVVTRVLVVLTIIVFLLLKALSFRRAGKFGEMMSKTNVTVALAYAGTLLLLIGLDFFRTTPWVLGISFTVMIYVVKGGKELKNLYGSWKLLFHEAWVTILEIRDHWLVQPLGMKLATVVIFVEFWAAVALVEVRGVPEEFVVPTQWVHPENRPTPMPTPTILQRETRPLVPRPTRTPVPTPTPIEEGELRREAAFVPIRISEARLQAWAAINPCAQPLGTDWVCLVQHQPIAQPPYGY